MSRRTAPTLASLATLSASILLIAACADSSDTPASTASQEIVPAAGLVDIKTQRFVDRPMPTFRADAAWPSFPENLIIGQTPGLAVDSEDNVWILHRPNSLTPNDVGADADPPMAVCCNAAPHIIKFSQDGEYLSAFGGPEHAIDIEGVTQWPSNVHGLFVAGDGTVWIGGNGDGDHVVLNFTADGEFIRSIGERLNTAGNFDQNSLGNPADIAVTDSEVLVADGYINKRIIGFSSADGAFSRFWGAYAQQPDDETRQGAFDQSQAASTADGGANPESQSFGDIVHCVVEGPDGRIYVCDRRNNRIQVFATADDGSTSFVTDIAIAPETGGTRTASDIAFSPDGQFMYVADMMNSQVWILDAATYEQLGAFGRIGRYPGQFTWLHSVATDSDGNVYTTEVGTGRRVQKFVLTGLE